MTLAERETIFAHLVAIQDSGIMTTSQSRAKVRAIYGISDRQLLDIEELGVEEQWPPLNEEK